MSDYGIEINRDTCVDIVHRPDQIKEPNKLLWNNFLRVLYDFSQEYPDQARRFLEKRNEDPDWRWSVVGGVVHPNKSSSERKDIDIQVEEPNLADALFKQSDPEYDLLYYVVRVVDRHNNLCDTNQRKGRIDLLPGLKEPDNPQGIRPSVDITDTVHAFLKQIVVDKR